VKDRSDRSVGSDGSVGSSSQDQRRLRPSGGCRRLRSFQAATIIYDGTVGFCDRFLDKRTRTVDQMVQAPRSGRQNIAEGSRASATSSQTELRLVTVARASLDELLLDLRGLPTPAPAAAVGKGRARGAGRAASGAATRRPDRTDPSDPSDHAAYAVWLGNSDPAVVANALICLIHQANYLLDQQIGALERGFIEGGGYTEQLAAARIAERQRRQQHPPPPAIPPPTCPLCGKPMARRTARKGAQAGSRFWGCTGYPECRGTRRMDESDRSD
jgi:four helix bundle suffix protein